jgi:hypothetical protein
VKSFFGIDGTDVAVAILSGRDVEDVRARLCGVRAIVAGAHGLECEDADGHLLWTCSRSFPSRLRSCSRRWSTFASSGRSTRWRCTSAARIRTDQPFVAWAHDQELQVIHGRMVVEARVPGGGKGSALGRIAEHVGARRVVYAGDDATDFEALAFAASHGRAPSSRAAALVAGLTRRRTHRRSRGLCTFFAGALRG